MKNKNIMNPSAWTKMTVMLSLIAMLAAGCKDDFTSPAAPTGTTITSQLAASDNFNILAAALTKTNEAASLDNNTSGTFTVFAPHDSAFLAYFAGKLSFPALTEDSVIKYINKMTPSSLVSIATLNSVLTYHIVSSQLPSSLLVGPKTFATLNNARLSISKPGSQILLNANNGPFGSKVLSTDLTASNGVVHTINRVLVPPTVASAAAFVGISVSYATNPPTVTVGATNGNNYDVFANAIKVAGVASNILPNLSPLPELTLFAPTDAAFISYLAVADEAAAIAKVKTMTATDLAPIINYHIVPATRYLTTDMSDGLTLTAVSTNVITVHVTGNVYTLSDVSSNSADATISSANNLTNAGVVHGISVVLSPN